MADTFEQVPPKKDLRYAIGRLSLVVGVLAFLSCSRGPDFVTDAVSEYDARRSVEALERVKKFVPSEDSAIPPFVDDAATAIKRAALLSIFINEKEDCYQRGTDTPFLDCWETWRAESVVGRSDVDELIYGLAPWISVDEVDRLLALLPDKIRSRETSDIVRDEHGDPVLDDDGNARKRTRRHHCYDKDSSDQRDPRAGSFRRSEAIRVDHSPVADRGPRLAGHGSPGTAAGSSERFGDYGLRSRIHHR